MKFRTKKFLKDRDRSTERSRKGELRDVGLLPDKSRIQNTIQEISERVRKMSNPLFDKAESCPNKLALGCKLSKNRRTKPECEACL